MISVLKSTKHGQKKWKKINGEMFCVHELEDLIL
jgi:hypothetical protein